MLKIKREVIEGIQAATKPEHLYQYLQNAVELEHSTIPPYLTAMFSLKPGTNDLVARLIRSIVIQEMLHMTIAANVLVAIGGRPQINSPDFIPDYPGPLPMGIGGEGFTVPIKAFSKDLVKDVFMVIEEPEDPIDVRTAMLEAEPEFATIGEFYEAVQKRITDLGDGIFANNPDQQVLSWFSPTNLFPIVNVKTAVSAIDIIVKEGEGTSTDPFQSPGNPAHYYKFGEIYFGRKIIRQGDGYAYAGEEIPFDPAGVYPMQDNPRIENFPVGTRARILVERYCYSYSSLLNALHLTFNGDPDNIDAAIGLMYDLKLQAFQLMNTPAGDDGKTAGPSYQYVNVSGGVSQAG